jgi:hypothetical protein
MPEAWTAEELAAATGEPVDRLAGFAEAGLLLRRADGRYEGDAWSRVALIRFARERGVDEGRLAAAVAAQGDLLGIFERLGAALLPSPCLGPGQRRGSAATRAGRERTALGNTR